MFAPAAMRPLISHVLMKLSDAFYKTPELNRVVSVIRAYCFRTGK